MISRMPLDLAQGSRGRWGDVNVAWSRKAHECWCVGRDGMATAVTEEVLCIGQVTRVEE